MTLEVGGLRDLTGRLVDFPKPTKYNYLSREKAIKFIRFGYYGNEAMACFN